MSRTKIVKKQIAKNTGEVRIARTISNSEMGSDDLGEMNSPTAVVAPTKLWRLRVTSMKCFFAANVI